MLGWAFTSAVLVVSITTVIIGVTKSCITHEEVDVGKGLHSDNVPLSPTRVQPGRSLVTRNCLGCS